MAAIGSVATKVINTTDTNGSNITLAITDSNCICPKKYVCTGVTATDTDTDAPIPLAILLCAPRFAINSLIELANNAIPKIAAKLNKIRVE